MEFLEPEAYAVKHVQSGVKKLKFPGALMSKAFPTAQFRAWPKGTWDNNRYSRGADVFVQPRLGLDGYTLGNVATARVDADNGFDGHYAQLESGLYIPPLELELDGNVPADERTLKVIQTLAAHAVAARVALHEG